mgnify:CR=1 FL=1
MRERTGRAGVLALVLLLLAVVVAGLTAGGGAAGDRAYELESRLRCPVCKTVSIAESLSDTAAAMRATVEQQIEAGRSDEEIIEYFTDRYGEWVLMDPPVRGDMLALWLVPLLALLAGVAVIVGRRSRPVAAPPDLSEEDRARVASAVVRMRSAIDDDEDRL